MGYYVGLAGYQPAGRSDSRKWTHVGIFEAPGAQGQPGAWTEIDVMALADYPDPTAPPVFSFSTTQATAPEGYWYRVEFRDDFQGVQEGVPEYNGTAAVPEVEWIRATSNVDFAELGYPDPAPAGDDRLQTKLDEAVVQFQATLGIDPRTMPDADRRVVLVRMALRMLVEVDCAASQMEQLGTAADFDMLSGMSASDYSETRRGVVRPNPQVLHPWPALNRLLNSILYFDTQGNLMDEAPSVGVPPVHPLPYQETMRELYPRRGRMNGLRYLTGAVWPQPNVTNDNGIG